MFDDLPEMTSLILFHTFCRGLKKLWRMAGPVITLQERTTYRNSSYYHRYCYVCIHTRARTRIVNIYICIDDICA